MFDIGFLEIMIIAVISLLVVGPDRLPGAIRTTSIWIGRIRRSFQRLRTEIEDEIDADHIRRQLHNEAIMESLQKARQDIEGEVKQTVEDLKPNLDQLQYDIEGTLKPEPTDNVDTNQPANTDSSKTP